MLAKMLENFSGALQTSGKLPKTEGRILKARDEALQTSQSEKELKKSKIVLDDVRSFSRSNQKSKLLIRDSTNRIPHKTKHEFTFIATEPTTNERNKNNGRGFRL